MEEIIFKTIKTPRAKYVYDRSKNAVIRISDEEYEELCSIENKNLKYEESKTITYYQERGYLKANRINIIEHPCSCFLEHLLSNHIEQLTIQVTQRCNLRCKYCTYSGIYENHNRIHADYDMNFEMAKKAIDFYLNRSMEMNHVTFGFYGGEPLLKYDLIKECVKYIGNRVKNRPIHYTMTTNGTLLTPEIASFLFENDFSIVISLDGSKEEHNEYRVFPNGQGSFDIIIKNLRAIKDSYPKEFKKIRFNTVLNPKNNYTHLKLYFEEDELLGDSDVMMAIVDNKSSEKVKFGDEFYRSNAYDYFKLYLYMINKLDAKEVSKLVISQYALLKQKYSILTNNVENGMKAHHGGPCIPGGKRLFINVFGEFFPCERVGEVSEVMKIGNLNSGFNYQKASTLLNVGKVTEQQCLGCWALYYCDICCQKADAGDYLSKDVKTPYCRNSKDGSYYEIAQICALKELGCTFDDREDGFYENAYISTDL